MPTLSKNQKQWITRYIRKHNNSTLEIAERSWGRSRFIFTFIFVIFIYISFFKGGSNNPFAREVNYALFPFQTLEQTFKIIEDENNPGHTLSGEPKDIYISTRYKSYWENSFPGWIIISIFIGSALIYLKSTRPRGKFRLDRERKIIYTYEKDKLYITEIEKLSEPLYKYFSFKEEFGLGRGSSTTLAFWIHPYGKMSQLFIPKGVINLNDYSMRIFRNERVLPFLRQIMIEFLDPNTPQERINEILAATECKKDFFNKFIDPILAIFDTGFWKRRKWNETKLESQILEYFSNEAKKIIHLPICQFTPWGNDNLGLLPIAYFVPNKIIEVKELEKKSSQLPPEELYVSIDKTYMDTPMFNGFLEKLKEKAAKNQILITEDITHNLATLNKLKKESEFIRAKEWLTRMYANGSLVFLDDNGNIDNSPITPKPISKINIVIDYSIWLATTIVLLWGTWAIIS